MQSVRFSDPPGCTQSALELACPPTPGSKFHTRLLAEARTLWQTLGHTRGTLVSFPLSCLLAVPWTFQEQ